MRTSRGDRRLRNRAIISWPGSIDLPLTRIPVSHSSEEIFGGLGRSWANVASATQLHNRRIVMTDRGPRIMSASSARRSRKRKSGQSKPVPVGLIGAVLTDGRCPEILQHFEDWGHRLDDVTDDMSLLLSIGTPRRAGANYKKHRTPALKQQDARDAVSFNRAAKAAGGERFHVLGQHDAGAKLLKLEREPRPLIALWSSSSTEDIAVLRIPPEIVDRPETVRGMKEILAEGLAWRVLGSFSNSGSFDSPEAMEALRGHLRSVEEELTEAAAGARKRRSSEPAAYQIVSHEGRREVGPGGLREVLGRADEYDLLVDPSGRVRRAEGKKRLQDGQLTTVQLDFLHALVRADGPLEARSLADGICASESAVPALVRRVRKVVDKRLKPRVWQTIQQGRDPVSGVAGYRFKPPSELRYCVVLPVRSDTDGEAID